MHLNLGVIVSAVLATLVVAVPVEELEERAEPTAEFTTEVLRQHNRYRAQYGAEPLTWSDDLYPATLEWANMCKFRHSQAGGKYGENLYAGGGPSVTFAQGMKAWMDESVKYNYANPVFSGATGHFTQVVWKSTTQVACAMVDCGAGTIFSMPSKFVVCRYSPPGNYQGQFAENVGRRV
ncbi:CAP domain-containing protein [Crucibulum laeve]|uniref:CAP domain-containing protein n=1 Tax=Crucibulum laeve TaxID=68775 RepID=A0A5C3MII8_9AGAR|nr:CAP domain-containing protein [Crucibulum laeve]